MKSKLFPIPKNMRPLFSSPFGRFLSATTTAFIVVAGSPLHAADWYWDSDGNIAGASSDTTAAGTWGSDTFWSTSSLGDEATTAWTAGNTAVFAAGTDATGTYAVTVSGTQTTAGLKFQEGNVTLSGGTGITLTSAAVDAASGATATISTAIGGSAGLSKTGAGTLTLSSASNSFSGGVNISGGTLSIAAATNLPSGNVLTLSGGGVLAVSGNPVSLANNVTVASGQSGVIRASGSGYAILTGNYSNVVGALELDLGNGGRIDINSANGAGVGSSVTVSDAATSGTHYMAMNNANAQTFFTNAKVTFNDTGAGETNVYLGNNTGNWNFNFGALDGGSSTTRITSDNRTNTVTITGKADGNFTGIISNAGTIFLVKTGTGTQTLSGANNYSGTTSISNGTLIAGTNAAVSAAGAFGSAATAIALGDGNSISGNLSPTLLTGGAFTVGRAITVGSSNAATSGTYTIGGNTANTSAFSGAITLNQSLAVSQVASGTLNLTGNITSGSAGTQTLTVNNAGSVAQSTGVIGGGTGTIALTKSGAGTLTLSGANSYTGKTTIQQGTLTLDIAGTLGTTSEVAFAGGSLNVIAKGPSGYAVTKVTGSGNVIGVLTVTSQLAIGNSAGTISFDDLTVGNTSTSVFEVGGGAGDLANVTDDLTLGGTLDLNLLSGQSYVANQVYTLFGYTAGNLLTGTFKDGLGSTLSDGATFTDAGGVWTIDYDAQIAGLNGGTGNRFVTVTAVPEPAAALLGSLGLLALLRRRRA
jgi:fibronectin-binding autotransporter adhesin